MDPNQTPPNQPEPQPKSPAPPPSPTGAPPDSTIPPMSNAPSQMEAGRGGNRTIWLVVAGLIVLGIIILLVTR